MTRKDYCLIASAIRASAAETDLLHEKRSAARIADNLAAAFERDNPRFDRARFLSACGVGESN